jgi:hypothetical protein
MAPFISKKVSAGTILLLAGMMLFTLFANRPVVLAQGGSLRELRTFENDDAGL